MTVYFNKIFLATALLLSLMLVISCENTENPSAPDGIAGKDGGGSLYRVGASVSGQGSVTIRPGQSSEFTSILVVNAGTHPNGSVSGKGVLKSVPNGTINKFDIDCIEVVGNVARMTGVITMSNAPVNVGSKIWVTVVDNGAAPDDFGSLFGGAPDPCNFDQNPILNPAETGNFVVNP